MRRCQEPGYYIVRNPGGCELGPNVSAAGDGPVDAHAFAVVKAILRFDGHEAMISPRPCMVKGKTSRQGGADAVFWECNLPRSHPWRHCRRPETMKIAS